MVGNQLCNSTISAYFYVILLITGHQLIPVDPLVHVFPTDSYQDPFLQAFPTENTKSKFVHEFPTEAVCKQLKNKSTEDSAPLQLCFLAKTEVGHFVSV
jgi:hypothetical protein